MDHPITELTLCYTRCYNSFQDYVTIEKGTAISFGHKNLRGPMASSLCSIVVMNSTSNHHHHEDKNSNNNISSSTSISTVDWDEWDESLWTDEQRQWLETASVPREVYVTMSVVLSLVVFFGLIANATILYVFFRYCIFLFHLFNILIHFNINCWI